MSDSPSVPTWVQQLLAGDPGAATPLWRRSHRRLVELARDHLAARVCRATDEEDVALSAFASFCRAAQAGRFPDLAGRDGLWRLLLALTVPHARRETARKRRGGHAVLPLDLSELAPADREWLASAEPDPALAAAAADQARHLLAVLPGDDLRRVAVALMGGDTAAAAAARLGCGVRTIERKRQLIRRCWQEAGDA